jgi:molybdate transport system substrate-binding protein
MKPRGRYVEIPVDLYPPLQQAAVILASSSHKKAAVDFLTFLKSPAAQKIFEGYGFTSGHP